MATRSTSKVGVGGNTHILYQDHHASCPMPRGEKMARNDASSSSGVEKNIRLQRATPNQPSLVFATIGAVYLLNRVTVKITALDVCRP
jgi:hypothetical protein